MHPFKGLGALQFSTLRRLQCWQAPLGEVGPRPHLKSDAHIHRERGRLSPGGLTVGPVKCGGRIGVRAEGKALALELDPTLVPVSEPLQADRRRITPGSQIVGEFQDRQDLRHGDLF